MKYKVTVIYGGQESSMGAKDIQEISQAIFRLKPEKISSKVIVRIEDGEKTRERMLYVNQARKVFTNALSVSIFVKFFLIGLK